MFFKRCYYLKGSAFKRYRWERTHIGYGLFVGTTLFSIV